MGSFNDQNINQLNYLCNLVKTIETKIVELEKILDHKLNKISDVLSPTYRKNILLLKIINTQLNGVIKEKNYYSNNNVVINAITNAKEQIACSNERGQYFVNDFLTTLIKGSIEHFEVDKKKEDIRSKKGA